MRFLSLVFILSLLFSPYNACAEISATTEPYPGYTLIAPNEGRNGANGKNEIKLINLAGDVIHSWQLNTAETQFAKLEQNGTLLAILGSTSRPTTNAQNQTHARIVEIDWEGNITWEYQNEHLHHDFARLANGNILAIIREPLTTTSANIWVDRFIEIDYATKKIVWEWGMQDKLDLSLYPYNGGGEIFHTNAISYLPAENAFNKKESFMISSREQSMIMIIEKESGNVVWTFSNGVLEKQHDPTLLENGNILVFNNRPSQRASQVLEINPTNNSIVWTYEAPGFFAEKISGAQRLPNGNTLITEGTTGTIFEVNTNGETLWEYKLEERTKGRSIFRVYRYGIADIHLSTPSLPTKKQYLFLPFVIFALLACLLGGITFFTYNHHKKSAHNNNKTRP